MIVQFNTKTMKWEGNPCNDPTLQVITFTIVPCLLHIKLHYDCIFVAGIHVLDTWSCIMIPLSVRNMDVNLILLQTECQYFKYDIFCLCTMLVESNMMPTLWGGEGVDMHIPVMCTVLRGSGSDHKRHRCTFQPCDWRGASRGWFAKIHDTMLKKLTWMGKVITNKLFM